MSMSLEEALAYITPHPLTKGSMLVTADRLRAASDRIRAELAPPAPVVILESEAPKLEVDWYPITERKLWGYHDNALAAEILGSRDGHYTAILRNEVEASWHGHRHGLTLAAAKAYIEEAVRE